MRLASLSPAVTEILYVLNKQELIVCTDQFSNFPEEARQLPHVKDHMKVDPEEIRAHDADLVFTSTPVQEKLAQLLRSHGFSVVHQDPRSIHDVYESIRSIGTLLECEAEAKQLVLTMQQGFNDVKRKAALLPKKLKVYIEEWHDPPFVSGNWVPEVARFAGVEQFPLDVGSLSREATLQEVTQWNPDMIVISYCGAGSLAEKELLTGRAGWDDLLAVQQGNVRVIDDSLLNRPGPRLVEGAQRLYGWAFEQLH